MTGLGIIFLDELVVTLSWFIAGIAIGLPFVIAWVIRESKKKEHTNGES